MRTLAAPAFAVFEGWAFALIAAGDLELDETSRDSNHLAKPSSSISIVPHPANPAQGGAASCILAAGKAGPAPLCQARGGAGNARETAGCAKHVVAENSNDRVV